MPCRGRRRPPALGSEGVRAVERAAGVETGEGCLLPSAVPAAPCSLRRRRESIGESERPKRPDGSQRHQVRQRKDSLFVS